MDISFREFHDSSKSHFQRLSPNYLLASVNQCEEYLSSVAGKIRSQVESVFT